MNIVFLKTHKTAGSTVQNILMRYGLEKNLTFALPAAGHRQHGNPTWFLTLSAADMQWPKVIQSIAHQYGKCLTDEDIKNMPWEKKCSWLRYNPVTTARQFNHRLKVFSKDFIGGKANPN
ncbi:hypothetical protein Bbelb_276170 [Branchiostoma belcheri]|nr:hypothetical protein Bbelb_276170 [Branchiostoma belcheri]